MLVNVQEIISSYKENMLPEHLEFFKEFDKFQRKFKGVKRYHSKYGEHWSNCPWAYDETVEGPDTCLCLYYVSYKNKLEKLIHFYSGMLSGER
jgi:hypothetical protein